MGIHLKNHYETGANIEVEEVCVSQEFPET